MVSAIGLLTDEAGQETLVGLVQRIVVARAQDFT